VACAHALDAGQMRDFDRGQRFDHHLRVALLQAAEHVDVVLEAQLGMQATDNVELAGWIVARGIGLGEHLVQAARVRAVFFRHPREGAEHAGVAQDADIRRIDVLIGGEVDALAVLAHVRKVREATDGQEVVRCKKREAILARQPLAAFDLVGDRSEIHAALRTASVTLWPPKPNEFERATSTRRSTALLGAESRSHAGSAVNCLMVGGMTPFWLASAQIPSSRARAAPSRRPVIDFVGPQTRLRAGAPNPAL